MSRQFALGRIFRTCRNFWESTDFYLVLSQIFPQIQKPHRHYFDCDSLHESPTNQTQNKKQSSLRDSAQSMESSAQKIVILSVAKNPNLKNSPSLAYGNIFYSPSLAEGARGWVKLTSSLRDSALCAESWQSTFKNAESTRFAESANKTQQTIEAIAVEVVGFLDDFRGNFVLGDKARLKSAQCPKSSKSTQDARISKLQQDILQKAIVRDS